ncbi:uncharacterized protein LOC131843505 [Achroia grisella]|uniref:uncharacterized protein LOC131843505 n=1 Tax=Achroia grisella TaxID=688607 RepID=UPI0027D30E6D|nr:uncharacterized protein LOC131843505 [Achroia grisella]
MNKFAVVFVLAAFLCITVNAYDFQPFDAFGFPAFTPLKINIPKIKPLTPEEIKNLKPSDGSVVNGASVSSSSSYETVNGVPVRKDITKILTNNNGDVKEYTYGN